MNSFFIYLLTAISGTFTLGFYNCDFNTEISTTKTSITNDLVALSISKLEEDSYNLMAVINVASKDFEKQHFEVEDFETLINYKFHENDHIVIENPIVEAFRGCKIADSDQKPPITNVRVNTIIKFTDKGKTSNSFEIDGNVLCTMKDYCYVNDASFKLVYKDNNMSIIKSYPALIYSY